jgi:hypothetical protein
LTAQLNTQGETYLNHVTHTWALTGLTPVSGTDIKVYQSTWAVVGQGTHQRQYGDGRTLTEQWTTSAQTLPDTMTIRVSADGLVHINSGAQLRSTTATSGTSITHSINGNARDETRAIAYNVDEWVFPVVQDAATKTTISGSTTGPATNIAPGQPPGTLGTAACSWQFNRGATAAMAPPPASGSVAQAPPSPTLTAVPIIPTLSTATAGGTTQTAPTTNSLPTVYPGSPSQDVASTLPAGGLTAAPAPSTPPTTQATQDVIGSCVLRGPTFGTRETIDAYASPIRAYLTWDAVAGATGYKVLRSDLGVIAELSATTRYFNHSASLQPGATYVYIIAAQYLQGCGATGASVEVHAPRPAIGPISVSGSPCSGGTTCGLQPGQVKIPWTVRAPDVSGAHIEGPTLPQGGVDVRPSNSNFTSGPNKEWYFERIFSGVPRGSQTWTVSSYWEAGGKRVLSDPTSATVVVP